MWEDTVMEIPLDLNGATTPLLEKQAEITWDIAHKAGRESMADDVRHTLEALTSIMDKEHQAGMTEVVEFVKTFVRYLPFQAGHGRDGFVCRKGCLLCKWQAKLKKWGIDREVKE